MPPVKCVTLRQRTYNMMVDAAEHLPTHGHIVEFGMEVIGLACSVMFVIGSYCFQSPDQEVYMFGDILFIIACVINTCFSIIDLVERLHHASVAEAKERDEVLEAACSLVSNIAFTVGCVFFLPSISHNFDLSAALGAWFCIVGSFGLIFSVFLISIGFVGDSNSSKLEPAADRRCRQLGKLNICLLLLGTVFFTVGSFMYRPIFGGKCPPGSSNTVCMSVAAYGTKCYLYGSYLFVISSILSIVNAVTLAHGKVTAGDPTEATKLMPGA